MEFIVGNFFKKSRKRKGLNQEEIAHQMHVPQSTVSRWESGKIEPRAIDLITWVKATNAEDMLVAVTLGVDPSMIMDGTINLMDLLTNITPGLINLIGVIL